MRTKRFINKPKKPCFMVNELICSSCKKRIVNMKGVAMFMCPKCGKQEIIRCPTCRKIVAKYTCPECNFTGPN